ncbi:hypothetical protein ACKC9G_09435 [Pokkaliibacter sp. CJK22405]|uniref:hypothetical protein n=1 Tax=Pokkaliibacter sp. CJK22405 TaxID=3384615 RepID=UPI00398503E0
MKVPASQSMIASLHLMESKAGQAHNSAPQAASVGMSDQERLARAALLSSQLDSLAHAPDTQWQHNLQRVLQQQWRVRHTRQPLGFQERPFAAARAKALGQLPGGKLASREYGISFANEQGNKADIQKNLQFMNPLEGDYHRDNPGNRFLDACRKLYQQQNRGRGSTRPLLFVHSEHAATQLLELVPEHMLIGGSIRAHLDEGLDGLGLGVYALELKDSNVFNILKPISDHMGTLPSLYRLCEALESPEAQATQRRRPGMQRGGAIATTQTPAAIVNNTARLDELRHSGVSDRLRQLPPGHAHAAQCRIAANLVDDLITQLDKKGLTDAQKKDPVLANGLEVLHKIADSLPSLTHDTPTFAKGCRALAEELHLCLAATKPYTPADFRKRAEGLLAPEHQPDNLIPPRVFMASSGMGAIGMGMAAVGELTGNYMIEPLSSDSHGTSPLYYEAAHLQELTLSARQEGTPVRTVMASLNHSMPAAQGEASWNVDKLIGALDERLGKTEAADKPLVLLLDATLEHRDDMARLTSHFSDALQQGELKMVVCKSYQKFANLGTSKVMAGAIGLISKADEQTSSALQVIDEAAGSSQWVNNRETQLMTHLLGQRDGEFALLEHAVSNANFVNDLFKDAGGKPDHFEPHLPFVAVTDQEDRRVPLRLHLGENEELLRIQRSDQMPDDIMHTRDSFAFTESTSASIPIDAVNDIHATRFSFGQESKSELMERFYLASHLLSQPSPQWSVGQADQHIQALIQQALPRGEGGSMAQKLQAIARHEQFSPDDNQRLTSSVQSLRHAGQSDGARGMTLNKIASVMIHLANVLPVYAEISGDSHGPDRQVLDDLLKGMIDSGMPGLSDAARSSILSLDYQLTGADLLGDDPQRQQQALARQVESARRYPGLAVNGDAMLNSVTDKTFSEASEPLKQDWVSAMFLPLDHGSRVTVIQEMIDTNEFAKAEACLEAYQQHFGRLPASETLTSGASGNSATPRRPTADEYRQLSAQLIRQRLALSSSDDGSDL